MNNEIGTDENHQNTEQNAPSCQAHNQVVERAQMRVEDASRAEPQDRRQDIHQEAVSEARTSAMHGILPSVRQKVSAETETMSVESKERSALRQTFPLERKNRVLNPRVLAKMRTSRSSPSAQGEKVDEYSSERPFQQPKGPSCLPCQLPAKLKIPLPIQLPIHMPEESLLPKTNEGEETTKTSNISWNKHTNQYLDNNTACHLASQDNYDTKNNYHTTEDFSKVYNIDNSIPEIQCSYILEIPSQTSESQNTSPSVSENITSNSSDFFNEIFCKNNQKEDKNYIEINQNNYNQTYLKNSTEKSENFSLSNTKIYAPYREEKRVIDDQKQYTIKEDSHSDISLDQSALMNTLQDTHIATKDTSHGVQNSMHSCVKKDDTMYLQSNDRKLSVINVKNEVNQVSHNDALQDAKSDVFQDAPQDAPQDALQDQLQDAFQDVQQAQYLEKYSDKPKSLPRSHVDETVSLQARTREPRIRSKLQRIVKHGHLSRLRSSSPKKVQAKSETACACPEQDESEPQSSKPPNPVLLAQYSPENSEKSIRVFDENQALECLQECQKVSEQKTVRKEKEKAYFSHQSLRSGNAYVNLLPEDQTKSTLPSPTRQNGRSDLAARQAVFREDEEIHPGERCCEANDYSSLSENASGCADHGEALYEKGYFSQTLEGSGDEVTKEVPMREITGEENEVTKGEEKGEERYVHNVQEGIQDDCQDEIREAVENVQKHQGEDMESTEKTSPASQGGRGRNVTQQYVSDTDGDDYEGCEEYRRVHVNTKERVHPKVGGLTGFLCDKNLLSRLLVPVLCLTSIAAYLVLNRGEDEGLRYREHSVPKDAETHRAPHFITPHEQEHVRERAWRRTEETRIPVRAGETQTERQEDEVTSLRRSEREEGYMESSYSDYAASREENGEKKEHKNEYKMRSDDVQTHIQLSQDLQNISHVLLEHDARLQALEDCQRRLEKIEQKQAKAAEGENVSKNKENTNMNKEAERGSREKKERTEGYDQPKSAEKERSPKRAEQAQSTLPNTKEGKEDKKNHRASSSILSDWRIVGFSGTRVVIQDKTGLHFLTLNQSLNNVTILDIDADTGRVKTSAGVLSYR